MRQLYLSVLFCGLFMTGQAQITATAPVPAAVDASTPQTLAVPVLSGFPSDTWTAFADVSWYNTTDTTFSLSNAAQLAGLAKLVQNGNTFENKTIELSVNADLGAHIWIPIGYNHQKPFKGIFKGNNHTLTNLMINRENGDYLGLFGFTSGAQISDITVDTAKIQGKDTMGTLIGNMLGGSLKNAHAKNITIVAQYNPAFTTSGYNTGGLCGSAVTDALVENCSAQGYVGGFVQIGGLIGSPWNKAIIRKSSFTGTVEGAHIVGGFVGFSTFAFGANREVVIENCYAKATVSGQDKVGGFYGSLANGIIKSCYAAGTVTSDGSVGAFMGHASGGSVTNCYFDSSLSSLPGIGAAENTSPQITGKTTAEMKTAVFATLLNTGSTETVWYYNPANNDGYPAFTMGQLGTAEVEARSSVLLYPALADDAVYIQGLTKDFQYQITDASGRALQRGVSASAVQVSALKPGVYFLQIKNSELQKSFRFIKK